MEKEQRSRLQKATQEARRLLEEEFSRQLLETYDINVAAGRWSEEPGAHLQAEQRLLREKLLAWIEHRSAQINDEKEALLLALREMAFTALNRFVALKLMEARELVRPCVSGGLESEGFQEFTAVAQGLLVEQESSYRLYLETIFEDVSRELRALFDPRDPASLLWPKRTALLELLDILNRPQLAELWREDETLGWIYQYFNGNDVKEMRDAAKGGAPRNSRELAVRNQFFTPRYVVEFLTDNTLGRIWYEMRQGNTSLKEGCRYLVRRPNEIWLQPGEEAPAEVVADEALSQEELLRQPVHIPYRPLKDPREIRMLDPACGSMHFGLYAFDLYIAIYEEAWEIAQGSDEQAKQGGAFAAFVAYAADFASKAAFLREVPRLILLHNIHGVDIDPRATQIARLTLWLRAQRAWQEQQLEVAVRPAISRSNVVCAEPMPGEQELLADFVDEQFPEAERWLVQQLLEVIFEKMQLAGEAGSLLKIEEEIRDAIDQARREWQKLAIQQRDLFSPIELAALGEVGSSLNTDLQNLTKDFWIDIEERIYASLSDYADQAESGSGLQRRLFAEDAAQGFAFIDICKKRYDVALMNPPFGEAPLKLNRLLVNQYKKDSLDIFDMFYRRAFDLVGSLGKVGAITPRTMLYQRRFAQLREYFTRGGIALDVVAELGLGVLDDATVRPALFAISKGQSFPYNVLYVDLLNASHPDEVLLNGVIRFGSGRILQGETFHNIERFASFPDCRFSFWAGSSVLDLFNGDRDLEPHIGKVTQGLSCDDDNRFLRCWWEVPVEQFNSWKTFGKFDARSTYIADFSMLIDWSPGTYGLLGTLSNRRANEELYYNPGIAFTRSCEVGMAATVLPRDLVFSTVTRYLLPNDGQTFGLLAYLNTKLVEGLHLALTPDRDRVSGTLRRVPVFVTGTTLSDIEISGREIWAVKTGLVKMDETNRYYAGACSFYITLARLGDLDRRVAELHQKVLEIEAGIEERVSFDCPANATDLRILYERVAPRAGQTDLVTWTKHLVTATGGAFNLLAECLGVSFGRWDIRYATGEQSAPELPDPFAPLPVCPSGQLQNAQGLPARTEDVPSSYPVHISWVGILVDDPNHALDLECRVREVIEIIWNSKQGGATAEAIEHEACEILGVKTLRDYFRMPAGFFAEHLKRYSKSRRQAPIYWPLSAGNGNYSAWLYYHRFTQDTLYRLLRDFIEPRIQEAEREQFRLEFQGGLSGDAAGLQEAQTLLQDLRLFKSELELVAPLWNPNLNDGVIINHAILWRITPYTPWQKKCKECWDKLVKGDYDWAHLAFHLWPERVIRKCTTDRSLAIAHGLEERLWQETSKGNWLQRQMSDAELQALLAVYSKPAVQNALERFLAASPPVAAARTRAPRAAKSSSTGTTRRPRGSAPEVDAETSRQTLLVLTAAPAEGLGRNAIAELLGVEAASLTAVIKQLKEGGQIEQLGAARGAKYRLTESGLAAIENQAGEGE